MAKSSRVESWIRLALGGTYMVLISAIFFVLMIPLLPWRVVRIKACNVYGTIAGRTLLWFAGARPVVYNRELIHDHYPAIYVSNHTSTLDIWMGMWVCPMGGVGLAKKEMVKIPGLGQLYLLSGHPMIDRSNRERAIATMDKMAAFMNRHRLALWMWPEGTRSRDGDLGAFRKGFVHAAIATGLPVVPVVIFNAARIWPVGTMRMESMELHIEVLPAIDTSNWTRDTLDAHVKEVRDVFVEQLALGAPDTRPSVPSPAAAPVAQAGP